MLLEAGADPLAPAYRDASPQTPIGAAYAERQDAVLALLQAARQPSGKGA
jgi:hypothetical protein